MTTSSSITSSSNVIASSINFKNNPSAIESRRRPDSLFTATTNTTTANNSACASSTISTIPINLQSVIKTSQPQPLPPAPASSSSFDANATSALLNNDVSDNSFYSTALPLPTSSSSSSSRKSIINFGKWNNRFARRLFGVVTPPNKKNRIRRQNDCEIYDNDANIMALSCTAADEEIVPLSLNCAERIVCKNNVGGVGNSPHHHHQSHTEYLEQRAELIKENDSKASLPNSKIVTAKTTAVLNIGEDDELTITGYRRSILRTLLCWFCVLTSAGLVRLFMHWRRHWLLLATHEPCGLDVAEKILIREYFEGKHTVHYVKDVITLNADIFREMRNSRSKKSEFMPFDDENTQTEFDGNKFQLSIHLSGGIFQNIDSLRLFKCKQLRYIWDERSSEFAKLKGLDENVPAALIHQQKGLDVHTQRSRQLVYGLNQIFIPLKGVFTLLCLEVLNPYYVFQVFSVILWFSYNYYYYAVVIVLMSVFGITMSIIQTRKNQLALYKTVMSRETAVVVRANGTAQTIDTKYLVPGDILEIPSSGCTMQCDAVLLSGNCILDESMLTGESVPITKTPLPCIRNLIFDTTEHSRHVLFSGTKVIQTRYIGTEKVLACVINTGNITAKGGLVRSILYPPPVDYKFEQDSYKYIMLLGLTAALGFIYTVASKIQNGVAASKIAIESLDLITIAVPPALPAAMAVGRFYAQKRLEKNNIFCISPRSITVAGSIDCVCFDKTGTLTEDGLDMWGIVPTSSTNLFQMPLRQVERLPFDHLLFGMVTCHSITIMNGEMKGDPLDLKMFESTGWLLEEANVSDDTKYDLLFPTIVRPPRRSQNVAGNSHGSSMDTINEFDNAQNKSASSTELNGSTDIGIVREFSFTSSLQRMSVITRKLMDTHFNVYCKGSPEMILTLCKPETIPSDFHPKLDIYAQQGYRIIAIAYKMLSKKMTYAKVQRVSREKIECDLTFLGFVILENRLKPDTLEIINSLMAAHIRTIMVTGDNILTALSVATDCDMIPTGQHVIIVTAKPKPLHPNEYELIYNLTGAANNTNAPHACTGENNSLATNLSANRHEQLKPKPNGFIVNERDETTENCTDYALMTNSNSIASLETVDTCTQTTQITHRDVEMGGDAKLHSQYHSSGDAYDDDNSLKLVPELPNNNYRFAMTGKTWSVIRDYFPEMLPKFVTRGTVFARMSPEQKQALVLELQDLGYYVAMCGDGANDCGALKAAHAGISLSEAESSVASPFTSKNSTIACVPNVIKEGRCALVTSIAIFKYMAAYSLVQFASVLILYSIEANLTDIEYLFIDLFMISIFAFFFGKTEAYYGPLVKQTPLNSLISMSPIASLVLHLLLAFAFQAIGWFHLQQQSWYVPFHYSDVTKSYKGYENYTIFIISCFQYIILAVVFSKGAPYRKSIFTNIGFICSLSINTIISVLLAVVPLDIFVEWFDLMYPPDPTFRMTLVGIGFCNFILSMCIELFLIENLLTRRLRYRFHNIEKSRRKFLAIENHLRQETAWPPISQYGNDAGGNSGGGSASTPISATVTNTNGTDDDHQSPKSFTEICVESDVLTPFDNCNSVLKGFFDNMDSESDSNDAASDSEDEDATEVGHTNNGEQKQIETLYKDNLRDTHNGDHSSEGNTPAGEHTSVNNNLSFDNNNSLSSPSYAQVVKAIDDKDQIKTNHDSIQAPLKSKLLFSTITAKKIGTDAAEITVNDHDDDNKNDVQTRNSEFASATSANELLKQNNTPHRRHANIINDVSENRDDNNSIKFNNVNFLNKCEAINSSTQNDYEINEILATTKS